jgi:hypothetical protein
VGVARLFAHSLTYIRGAAPRMPPSRTALPHAHQIRYPPLAPTTAHLPLSSSSLFRDTDAWVQWHYSHPRIGCIIDRHEFTRNAPDTWVHILHLFLSATWTATAVRRSYSRAQCQYTLAGGGVVNARSPRISGSDFRAGSRLETKLYVARRGGPTAPRGRRSFHSSPVKLFSRPPIPPTTHLPFLSLCLTVSLRPSKLLWFQTQPRGSRDQGARERDAASVPPEIETVARV